MLFLLAYFMCDDMRAAWTGSPCYECGAVCWSAVCWSAVVCWNLVKCSTDVFESCGELWCFIDCIGVLDCCSVL